jgi:hypothetical protein
MFRKLFVGLLLLSMGAVTLVVAADLPTNQKADKAQKAQYPPYPDVWDWQVPEADRPIDVGMDLKLMDNGDVMIAYKPEKRDAEYRYVSYFGKSKVINSEAIYKGKYEGDEKYSIPLGNTKILRAIGGGMRSGGCIDDLRYEVAIYNKADNEYISGRKLLYVFDEPKYYETHYPDCLDGPSFYYKVNAVNAKFLPLQDGTFLLIVPEGYIIRFDEKFQTKSKLINDRFFWMEDNVLRKFIAKYGDRYDGDKNLKQLYTDLYQMLMNKRGKK